MVNATPAAPAAATPTPRAAPRRRAQLSDMLLGLRLPLAARARKALVVDDHDLRRGVDHRVYAAGQRAIPEPVGDWRSRRRTPSGQRALTNSRKRSLIAATSRGSRPDTPQAFSRWVARPRRFSGDKTDHRRRGNGAGLRRHWHVRRAREWQARPMLIVSTMRARDRPGAARAQRQRS